MTAAELVAAAELIRCNLSTDKFNDLTPGYEEAADLLSDYIRATVRSDDDEAVTGEWCAGVGIQDTDLVEVLKDRLRNESYKTRGDVRKLCSALGIELKEPQ